MKFHFFCFPWSCFFPKSHRLDESMSCRRSELGALGDDGLALYLGAWESLVFSSAVCGGNPAGMFFAGCLRFFFWSLTFSKPTPSGKDYPPSWLSLKRLQTTKELCFSGDLFYVELFLRAFLGICFFLYYFGGFLSKFKRRFTMRLTCFSQWLSFVKVVVFPTAEV